MEKQRTKILYITSEALPFAATGGLGDVAGSLPAALKKKGINIRVAMPLYSSIKQEYRDKMQLVCEIEVPLSWRNQYCGVYKLTYGGVIFYFIDNEYYFKRESMYGSFDDGERYAFFSRAILEMLPAIKFFPDILHTNDWQSALCSVYLKTAFSADERYNRIKSIHTIHNIDYQGIYDMSILYDVFGIPGEYSSLVEYNGAINLTKGAIQCCDILSTVSPKYAQEIQTPQYSSGLHFILCPNKDKIRGILNGIDDKYYNPELDNDLYVKYNSKTLEGKAENKRLLQKELALPERADVPLIVMITRLASHKGIDLVTCVMHDLLKADVQFAVLGTGEKQYEDFFKSAEAEHPDKVRAILRFDKAFSKKMYAAADIFLMPSKSEPCGLAQMIASRYGTVPLVRETGGLYDSIKYYNKDTDTGNGYTFANYNAHDMLYVLWEAIGQYNYGKEDWVRLVKKIMNIDFSWNASANEYIKMYNEVLGL